MRQCSKAGRWQSTRYQSHSGYKPLIYKHFLNCRFSVQGKRCLDFQGLAGFTDPLSTKLSTDNLDDLQKPSKSNT
jgi:hypothetical protein